MVRDASVEEIKAIAVKNAQEAIKRYALYGLDINPYCTLGARDEWLKGFLNKPPSIFDLTADFDIRRQLGKATAELLKSMDINPKTFY